MSKETNELRPQDPNKKPFYKTLAFPWLIIYTLVIGVSCFIAGSIVTHNQQDQVQAEARQMVTSLSKPQSH